MIIQARGRDLTGLLLCAGVTTTLPMIESGDMGKAVEVWQKIVGVKTKAATLEFQKAYRLEVDGIAGPESWGAEMERLL